MRLNMLNSMVQEKIDFEHFQGWRKLFKVFENSWKVKKSKYEKLCKMGPITCNMTRGFQIWSQNSNRIIFDSIFGHKTVKIRHIGYFAIFGQFFGQKGSNIIRFEFRDQIWDPLIILLILSPNLIRFLHFYFLTSHAFSKISNNFRHP